MLIVAALGAGLLGAQRAAAISLDDRDEIRLGLRAYTAVRVGTEQIGGKTDPLNFPDSAAGHVRQHRYFLELKLDHNIKRIAKSGWSFPWLLGWMNPNELKYTLVYRGEGEGIYDYGPSEYSNEIAKLRRMRLTNIPQGLGLSDKLPESFIQDRVRRLERIARQRHRLLQAYLDYEKGPLFVRVGRQVLAWGETDIFRLLDNINPLDDSFGGFFIALDERRLPVDMLRTSLQVGTLGPLTDSFLEGFAALGNTVSTQPGIPNGSAWSPGGLGFPNPALHQANDVPDRMQVRGGARYVANLGDATLTVAHYYTYLDVPGVQFRLPKGLAASSTSPILAVQRYPRVQISGGSVTFPLPSWYSIVRSEAAYFKGEPMNRQGRGDDFDAFGTPGSVGFRRLTAQNNTEGGLDPFLYPGFLTGRSHAVWGHVLQRDTVNASGGLDVNRLIRWLNPNQTVLLSTQLFYKHVLDSPGDLVLPVPYRDIPLSPRNTLFKCGGKRCNLRPRLYRLADNRFLQTLLITTSYSGGRIVPQLGMFYDWQGAIVFQPGVQFVRDPFRVIFDYTRIDGAPTGQFGAVRDKDNVRFQVEYVF